MGSNGIFRKMRTAYFQQPNVEKNLNIQPSSEQVKSYQVLSKSRIDIDYTEFFCSRSEFDPDQNFVEESYGLKINCLIGIVVNNP